MTDPKKIFHKEEACLPLDVLMNYIHDRLSDKERNHVERHTLQCGFCNEAMEGLALVEENKAIEMISSIDETNYMEQHILHSLDEVTPVEKNKKEEIGYELDHAPMAAAVPMKKARMAPMEYSISKEIEKPSKKSFDWIRIAASIVLILFVGGVGYYYLTNNSNPANTTIAVVKYNSSGQKQEIGNKKPIDSIIAISPRLNSSAVESKPNSDAVYDIKADKEMKSYSYNQNNEGLEERLTEQTVASPVLPDPSMMASPAKAEVQEDAVIDMRPVEEEYKKAKSSPVEKADNAEKREKSKKVQPRSADYLSLKEEDTLAGDKDLDNAGTGIEKGLTLYTKGEYQKAINYFESVPKDALNYEEARWYLAKSYLAIGEKEKANMLFKDIIEMNGKFKERAEEEQRKLE